jgi:branched-chain amino acid aminotransferase
MSVLASINGQVVPPEEARISVFDNGFTFGDSVYETLRTYGGRPFALGRHLARLRASGDRLGIGIPQPDDQLAGWLGELLARAANPESYIRFIVSRGVGDISYRFERVKGPTVVMVVKPYEPLPEAAFSEGIAVVVSGVRRNSPQALDPAIKSCNLLNNYLAVREAQAKGAIEAVMLNEQGEIAEGASSNIFVVKDGTVMTPPLGAGILAGITREVILGLSRPLGIPMREWTLRVPDLLDADEAFLTSTLKEAAPIRIVGDRPIGSGRPGLITLRILAAFREFAQRSCG